MFHPVGHSIAQFMVPNVSAAWILQAAQAHGTAYGMRVASAGPNGVSLSKGSMMWTGVRWMSVAAWDAPGGATVRVEAWIEGYMEDENANPDGYPGRIVRRDAWAPAASFVARLGVDPKAAFLHF